MSDEQEPDTDGIPEANSDTAVSGPEEDSEQDSADTRPKRRGKVKKRHTVAKVVITSLVVLGLVTAFGMVVLYRHLNDNLNVVDFTSEIGEGQPTKAAEAGDAINVLVMGSDTRDCPGCTIDKEAGGNASDTTILLHLSADRSRAYGVSIPRDSRVTRPDCGKNGDIAGGDYQMWNAAFSLGGPGCTIEQFQKMTGIPIDHYVVVNFGSFKDMVDALDGVPVCIPSPINDPAHGITLPAGHHTLMGDEALKYVRVRYTSFQDKSDLSRIKRQQAFIAAMINKVVSRGTLTRLDRLLSFLDASTKSLTLDPGLGSMSKLGKLGMQLRDVGLDNIQFVTVPWEYDRSPGNEYNVLWKEKEAKKLWKRVFLDKKLPYELAKGSITAGKPPGQETTATAGPSPSTSGSPSPSATDKQKEANAAAGLCT